MILYIAAHSISVLNSSRTLHYPVKTLRCDTYKRAILFTVLLCVIALLHLKGFSPEDSLC